MSWLQELAPMLGTALAGPLGGAAASFIASKLGLESSTIEAVNEVLNSGKMTPDQLAGLKLAEIDFKKFLETNKIDMEKIAAEDRGSAREMQIATRSWVPPALALIITVGYLGILIGMLLGILKIADNQVLLILIGALATGFGTVLNFFLGSSQGSQIKSAFLANSQPAK